MPSVNEHKPGSFCWVEVAAAAAAAAKRFYGPLFGWTFEDQPAGPDMVYSTIRLNGLDVGGLYEMNAEMRSQGIPSHWLSYVCVKSADETAKKVGALKGTLIQEPFDVFDLGRMAVLRDPTGANLAVWQPKKHVGARVVGDPGAVCWTELMTPNLDAAGNFYTHLFGWSIETQDMGAYGTYTLFMNGEQMAGGMIQITEDMGPVPPNWMVYIAVENADDCVRKASALGGRVAVQPTDVPGVGRFAVFQDPQGGAFATLQADKPH